MNNYPTLQVEKEIEIRFSEVDSLGIVWHGHYALFFEDARELFGKTYQLEYLYMFEQGYYAPLVEFHVNYKKAIKYKDRIKVTITYRNTESAKIIFDYEIYNMETGELLVTGYSVQVFLNRDYELTWTNPPFYLEWKKQHNLL